MRALAVATVLTLATGSAFAQPKPTADAEVTAAQHLYETGHYADAAAHFRAAYDLDPQPPYLYNAAQAYRLAKDCAKAATYYGKFLAAVKPDQVTNLDKVKRYLAEMQACAKPATTTPTTPTPPTPQVATTQPPTTTTPSEAKPGAPPTPAVEDSEPTPAPTAPESQPPSHLRRNVGIAVGAFGVVAGALGVYFAHQVNRISDERAALVATCPSPACTGTAIARYDREGHRDAAIAVTSYAVGGAAIAAGVALILLDRGDREHAVAVVPTRGGAAVGAVFHF